MRRFAGSTQPPLSVASQTMGRPLICVDGATVTTAKSAQPEPTRIRRWWQCDWLWRPASGKSKDLYLPQPNQPMPVAYSSLARFVDDMNVIKSLALQRPLHQAHHRQVRPVAMKPKLRTHAQAVKSRTFKSLTLCQPVAVCPSGLLPTVIRCFHCNVVS